MVDVVSLIIAILAAIIAVVAIVLIFVIPGSTGSTGPTGAGTGYTRVVSNATATSSRATPISVEFRTSSAPTVTIIYDNPTFLYNTVYNVNTGVFTTANVSGYYDIYTENAIAVNLTTSEIGSTTVYIDIIVGGVSVARSGERVNFDQTTTAETGLTMMVAGWQGVLPAGSSIQIQLTVESSYTGFMLYNYANMSRFYCQGVTQFI